jgi:hypothetical protein
LSKKQRYPAYPNVSKSLIKSRKVSIQAQKSADKLTSVSISLGKYQAGIKKSRYDTSVFIFSREGRCYGGYEKGGVTPMALRNRTDVVDEAVTRLLDEENAIDSADVKSYSRTVFLAFEKIRLLREKRISFVRICKSFEVSGMLPENASPHNFRQAYLREKARRIKTSGDAANTARKTPAPPSNPGKPDGAREPEKERTRKVSGTIVDTGLGKIIKHADGSFEY